MRILVCGGRDYANMQKVADTLEALSPSSIIHGCAAGADDLADMWAGANYVPVLPFTADWGGFGKAAGPLRNKAMLEKGKPDLVIAFPGGKGTANMVKQAREAGIPVMEVKDE